MILIEFTIFWICAHRCGSRPDILSQILQKYSLIEKRHNFLNLFWSPQSLKRFAAFWIIFEDNKLFQVSQFYNGNTMMFLKNVWQRQSVVISLISCVLHPGGSSLILYQMFVTMLQWVTYVCNNNQNVTIMFVTMLQWLVISLISSCDLCLTSVGLDLVSVFRAV